MFINANVHALIVGVKTNNSLDNKTGPSLVKFILTHQKW